MPLVSYYPISLMVVIISWYKLSKDIPTVTRKFLAKYSSFLFVYTIFWIPIPLLILLRDPYLDIKLPQIEEVAVLLATSSGLAINLTRIMDKAVMKFLLKSLNLKKSYKQSTLGSSSSFKVDTADPLNSNSRHDSLGGIYYIDFFEEIHQQVNIIRLCYLPLYQFISLSSAVR